MSTDTEPQAEYNRLYPEAVRQLTVIEGLLFGQNTAAEAAIVRATDDLKQLYDIAERSPDGTLYDKTENLQYQIFDALDDLGMELQVIPSDVLQNYFLSRMEILRSESLRHHSQVQSDLVDSLQGKLDVAAGRVSWLQSDQHKVKNHIAEKGLLNFDVNIVEGSISAGASLITLVSQIDEANLQVALDQQPRPIDLLRIDANAHLKARLSEAAATVEGAIDLPSSEEEWLRGLDEQIIRNERTYRDPRYVDIVNELRKLRMIVHLILHQNMARQLGGEDSGPAKRYLRPSLASAQGKYPASYGELMYVVGNLAGEINEAEAFGFTVAAGGTLDENQVKRLQVILRHFEERRQLYYSFRDESMDAYGPGKSAGQENRVAVMSQELQKYVLWLMGLVGINPASVSGKEVDTSDLERLDMTGLLEAGLEIITVLENDTLSAVDEANPWIKDGLGGRFDKIIKLLGKQSAAHLARGGRPEDDRAQETANYLGSRQRLWELVNIAAAPNMASDVPTMANGGNSRGGKRILGLVSGSAQLHMPDLTNIFKEKLRGHGVAAQMGLDYTAYLFEGYKINFSHAVLLARLGGVPATDLAAIDRAHTAGTIALRWEQVLPPYNEFLANPVAYPWIEVIPNQSSQNGNEFFPLDEFVTDKSTYINYVTEVCKALGVPRGGHEWDMIKDLLRFFFVREWSAGVKVMGGHTAMDDLGKNSIAKWFDLFDPAAKEFKPMLTYSAEGTSDGVVVGALMMDFDYLERFIEKCKTNLGGVFSTSAVARAKEVRPKFDQVLQSAKFWLESFAPLYHGFFEERTTDLFHGRTPYPDPYSFYWLNPDIRKGIVDGTRKDANGQDIVSLATFFNGALIFSEFYKKVTTGFDPGSETGKAAGKKISKGADDIISYIAKLKLIPFSMLKERGINGFFLARGVWLYLRMSIIQYGRNLVAKGVSPNSPEYRLEIARAIEEVRAKIESSENSLSSIEIHLGDVHNPPSATNAFKTNIATYLLERLPTLEEINNVLAGGEVDVKTTRVSGWEKTKYKMSALFGGLINQYPEPPPQLRWVPTFFYAPTWNESNRLALDHLKGHLHSWGHQFMEMFEKWLGNREVSHFLPHDFSTPDAYYNDKAAAFWRGLILPDAPVGESIKPKEAPVEKTS